MKLEHKALAVRHAAPEDAGRLADWWNDGAVMAHAGFPKGLGTTAEAVAASIREDSDETRRRLIIEVGGNPAGEMSYRNMGGGTAEISIKICDPSQQDKGQGKVWLSMLIAYLFSERGFKKIILDTNVKNKRAQHVYERLGFQRRRVVEDAWKDQMGELQSAVEYELVEKDFVDFSK